MKEDTDRSSLFEKPFRESDELFRSLVEISSEGIVLMNTEGRYMYASPAFERLSGYSRHELLGQPFAPHIYPDDLPVVMDSFQELLAGRGMEMPVEYRFLRKDGAIRFLSGIGKVLPNSQIVAFTNDITERKRAESQLRESEERFRTLVEISAEGICIINPEGNFVYTSPAFDLLSGYEAGELIGQSFFAIVPPEEQGRATRSFEAVYQNPNTTIFLDEYLHLRKDGTIRIAESWGKILQDGNVVAFTRDITDRVNAEETLRKNEEHYRSLIENASDIIALLSAEGTYEYVSPSFERVLGFAPDEIIGRPISEIVHPGDIANIQRAMTDAFENPGVTRPTVEFRGKHKDGSLRFMEAVGWVRADGKLVVNARDISDRKRAEERLRESEEQFRTLVEISTDGISIIDREGRLRYASPAKLKIFGYTEEEVLGKPFLSFIHSDDVPVAEKTFMQNLTQSGQSVMTEMRIRHKDGSYRITENLSKQMPDSNLVAYTRDVTEKRKLDMQLLRAQRMESIGTLAGGIAHDLNNVLAPILLSVEVLKKMVHDEKGRRILTTLESSAKRGSEMVKQVLTFARGIEGERVLLHPMHILKEIQKIAKETFPKSIEVRSDLSKGLWNVTGDATQIHQVLMNLCVNARDAMPSGGMLTIRSANVQIDEYYSKMHLEAKPGNYVVLSVEDTGMGIPQHLREKIFEPFFTTKEVGKGTGLGLSTVSAIVKSHGGFVNVYSEPGKGTEFRIYLPASVGMSNEDNKKELQELPMGNGELILVVDDESSIREVTVTTLEALGYRALAASDGTEGLAMFLKHQTEIAVILTDMMMPYMDGAAMIRALRRLSSNARIIAVSGLTANGEATESLQIDAFLPKPYTAEILIRTIENVLYKPEQMATKKSTQPDFGGSFVLQ